jgi:hypothetical protein
MITARTETAIFANLATMAFAARALLSDGARRRRARPQ